MHPRRTTALVLAILLTTAADRGHAAEFLLKGGETIVFFGDSITQSGGYVNDFETYLLSRFPGKTFRVINHGISSETISGTSEEDHDPRRPWALPRFTRDVANWKPDVVVACFGMNDGNYYPFEPTRFKAYQKGIRTLIARVEKETGAKLVLMTPPPFDPYRRRTGDPNAKTYGYKFAAIDYDETLRRYSEWLVSLRKEGRIVVDLHSKMNAHLKARRKNRVSFYLSPDAVHPNATGHFLMALHLLRELGAPAVAEDPAVDAAQLKSADPNVSELKRISGGVAFQWKSRVPMPVDAGWERASLELEKVGERLNRYRLSVTGLKSGTYSLSANGKPFAEATAKELAAGVDLTRFSKLPTVAAANDLRREVKARRGNRYRAWRRSISGRGGTTSPGNLRKRLEKSKQAIDGARRKQTLSIQIVRQ